MYSIYFQYKDTHNYNVYHCFLTYNLLQQNACHI